MKPMLMTTLALATMAAGGLTTLALAQDSTAPATEAPAPDAQPAPDRGPGAGMGPAGFDFATLDADGDGSVTKAEMDAFRAARGAEIDTDGDGFLTAEELAGMHIRAFTARANDMAVRMVEMRDSDGDGKLSAAEMIARPGPEMLFDRIDADGDGAVTQAEADAARSMMMERMGDHGERGQKRGGPRGHDHDGHGWGFGWFGGMGGN
jgi:hypothetical protein